MSEIQFLKLGSLLQGGKYKIERVLGQGGFGITYLATQDILDRKVAIKEFFFQDFCERDSDTSHVTLGTQANKEAVSRFLSKFIKEARTISKLHHPSIIPIYDIFRENGTAYFVMEYIDGESLGDMVRRRGYLPESEAISYICSAGEALSYIHQRNINHLDVKPNNIMIRRVDQQIILIDFGVAKQYDEQTKEGTTTTPVGISHGYSPAEQYRKNGVQTFSPQSDVYSLAATLFKLLTGKTPPEATEIPDIGLPIHELKQKRISESVIVAIEKAMKPRSIRTQSVALFLSTFEKEKDKENNIEVDVLFDETEPVANPEPKPQPAPKPNPRPNPNLNFVKPILVAVAGCILCLAVWHFWLKPEENEPKIPTIKTEVKNEAMTISLGSCVYSGSVDPQGKPNGLGEAKFEDGRVYNGPFVHGVAEGKGASFKYENGDTFEGTFKDNSFLEGRYILAEDGSFFVGTFKNGQPDKGSWHIVPAKSAK